MAIGWTDDRDAHASGPWTPFEPGSDPVSDADHTARDRLERAEALFHTALARPAGERASWLRTQLPDEPGIVADVLALLSADAAAGDETALWRSGGGCLAELLSGGAFPSSDSDTDSSRTEPPDGGSARDGAAATSVTHLAPGDRVGIYRIVRLLGAGGMGAVHLAERDDVGARVALKVVRSTYGRNARAEARFLAERRALARLGHPNVARLLDAGIVEGGAADGAPWFAMEYVDGEPIGDACDRQRLDVRARLTLLTSVCGAVEAAHQQLVIHRDLKPSNVLVTGDGRTMLLDFGIAATLDNASRPDGELPDGELKEGRAFARGLLTPQYAAPEQVRGDPPSVSVDVYALGLLLFELLTGRRPYEVRGRTRAAAARVVLDAQIPRLSDMVMAGDDAGARAAARATHPAALRRALRGDLDAIVERALARDPADRYATVGALCADLQRVLAHQPVTARAAAGVSGLAYRARRLVRRNRALVAMLAVVAGATTGAAVNYVRSAQLAAAERDRAREAAARAARVRDILVGLFDAADPDQPTGPTAERSSPSAILRRGEGLADALTTQPETQADLLLAIGHAWTGVGDLSSAARVFRRVVTIRRTHHVGDAAHDPLVADALDQLATVLGMADRMRAADSAIKLSITIRGAPRDSAGELALARTLVRQGRLELELGQCPAAIPVLHRAKTVFARWPDGVVAPETTAGSDAPRVLWPAMASTDLGLCLNHVRDFAAAGQAHREALTLLERHPTEFRLQYAKALHDYAVHLVAIGRYDEAEAVYRRTLALKRAMLPPQHPSIASTLVAFGALLSTTGRYAAAESSYAEGVAMSRATLGETHRRVPIALLGLGIVRWQRADAAGASVAFRDALRLARAGDVPRPSIVGRAAAGLGTALLALGRAAAAEPLLRSAVILEQTQRDSTTGPEFNANTPGVYEAREFGGDALRARWADALTTLGRAREAERVRRGAGPAS